MKQVNNYSFCIYYVLKFYHLTFEEGVYDPMYDYLAGLTRFN